MFFASSISVLAKTKTSDKVEARQQLVLLQEINRLLLEVQRLQLLLRQRTTLIPEQPYQSVFFDRPYEAIYFVDGINLRPVTKSGFVRPIDYELFKLLKETIGEQAVKEKVSEWRVFYDDVEDLGGFVELITGTEDWVFGVNRAQFETKDSNSTRSFANLFIHEYAHILLFNQPEFTKGFAEQFWSVEDKRHQAYVAQVSEKRRFPVLIEYFEANSERFVSDYATLSPDEDLAESFVAFVREEKPKGDTLRSEKINSFYNVPELVSERSLLRKNLERLGVLK